MQIIILQLARLGDILQSLLAVQGLKKKHPDCHITLVVRETFADAAKLSPHVDNLVEFPSRAIFGAKTEAEQIEKLARWINDDVLLEGNAPYDQLINLTFSPASAILASMIKAKQRRGVYCAADGPWVITDAWSQYFFAQVLGQNFNILHLNDLFLRIADAEKDCWPLELAEPASPLAVVSRKPDQKRIGVQLTASKPEKTLNLGAWKSVCEAILRDHPTAELVFFGSKQDVNSIEALIGLFAKEDASRCLVTAGTMRFNENVAWVKSCDWIVSPDTALVHLASICGTKVIEIPLGGVRPEETGPYGDGHHILYPAKADASQIGTEIARVISGEVAKTCVAQATTQMLKCTNGVRRNELVPHNFTPEETGTFFSKAYYVLAEFRCAGRQEDVEIPPLGDPAQPKALDRLVQAHDALCSIRRISEFGQHYCLRMLDSLENRDELNAWMTKIAEIEAMLENLKKAVPLVKPLIDTWNVAKDITYVPSGMPSAVPKKGDIEQILAITEGAYRELGQNVEIIQQLLTIAVEAAQKRKSSSQQISSEKLPKTGPSKEKEL